MRRIVWISLILSLFSIRFASAQSTFSYLIDTVPFNTVGMYPVTGDPIATPLIDDRWYGPFHLGFDFCFFGFNYDSIFISSNGTVSFTKPAANFISGQTFSNFSVTAIPNGLPELKNSISGPWMDWNPGQSGSLTVGYFGTAPNRKYMVSYNDVPIFGNCASVLGNFQIVMHEGIGLIENIIASKSFCTGGSTGSRLAVQGIVDPTGTITYVYPGRNATQWSAFNQVVRYTPVGYQLIKVKDQITNNANPYPDIRASCGTSEIRLKLNMRTYCSSIDTLGSDFRIVGPQGQNIPISKVLYTCRNNYTDSLRIQLASPISGNGIYYLIAKNGIDSNVLVSNCNAFMKVADTAMFTLSKCCTGILPNSAKLLNVSVTGPNQVRVDFRESDSTWIKRYNIERSTNGGPFLTMGIVNPSSPNAAKFFLDPVNTLTDILRYRIRTLDTCGLNVYSDTFDLVQLKGQAGQLQNRLNWTRFRGYPISDYTISRWNGTAWQALASLSPNDTFYVDTGLNCQKTYTYRIQASESMVATPRISLSDTLQLMAYDSLPPAVPSIRFATIAHPDTLRIAYTPSSSGDVRFYFLDRSINGGPWSVYDSVSAANAPPYLFTETGQSATVNVYSWRIRASDTCLNNTSAASQVHRAVRLSASLAQLAVQLNWTAYLGAAVDSQLVQLKTSSGWQTIAKVNPGIYQHLASPYDCHVARTFRVVAYFGLDSSLSTEATSTPFDTLRPNAPKIRSVRQMGSNLAVVKINRSSAPDVDRYLLYRQDLSGVQLVDTFRFTPGSSTLWLSDTNFPGIAGATYCYWVVALDSCANNASTPSDTDCLSIPVTSSSTCPRSLSLQWGAYQGWYTAATQANLQKSTSGGPWIPLGAIAPTQQQYRDTQVVFHTLYSYTWNGISSSSGDTISIISREDSLQLPPLPVINRASVVNTSTSNGSITIEWNAPLLDALQSTQLYFRTGSQVGFTPLGSAFPAGPATYIHTGRNTSDSLYQYAIRATDTCGYTTPLSEIHQPVNMTLRGGQIQHFLNWTAYRGWPVLRYRVFRLDNSGPVLVDSVPGQDTLSRVFPAPCNYDVAYRIEAVRADALISWSDTAVTRAIDTLPADAARIQSATVLSNTRTQLSFIEADSLDIFAYSLQRSLNGGPYSHVRFIAPLGPHQLQTVLDTVNTLTDYLSYRLVTFDSCLNATASDSVWLIQLKAQKAQRKNLLSWRPFLGLAFDAYRLERLNANNTWSSLAVLSASDTSFVDTGLNCNQKYAYRVIAIQNPGNTISQSDTAQATPYDSIPPSAPVLRYASVINPNTVLLKWKVPIEGDLAGQKVYYRTANGNWTLVGNLGRTDSLRITPLPVLDSVLSFTVSAYDTCSGIPGDSAQIHTAVQLKARATNLSAQLEWTPYQGFASLQRYVVEKQISGIWQAVDSVSASQTQWTDSPLPCNVRQFYRIVAVDGASAFRSLSDTAQALPFDTIRPDTASLQWVTVLSPSSIQVRIAPSASGDVNRYDLYFQQNQGSWQFLTSLNNPSLPITYTHSGINPVQNLYAYRVVAVDSCRQNRSDSSGFHTLVRVGGLAGNRTAKLNWNIYSGLQIDSQRVERFQNGSWVRVAILPQSDTTFTDTALGCGYALPYRIVSFSGNRNSLSNVISVTPFDTIRPLKPSLYSTQVLDGNRILLQWPNGPSPDVTRYEIWRARYPSQSFSLIKIVSSTSEVDTVPFPTSKNRYLYRIVARDSCNGGNRSDSSWMHISMDVVVRTGSCTPANVLAWTPYTWFTNGIGQYAIERQTNGGAWVVIGNANANDSLYTDLSVANGQSYTYRVRALPLGSFPAALSDTATLSPILFLTTPAKELLLSSVTNSGLTNGSIQLNWKKVDPSVDTLARQYKIYHSITSVGPYAVVASLPLSDSTWTHTAINTQTQRHFYKITVIDSCQLEGTPSVIHSPVNLLAQNNNLQIRLNWNRYQGQSIQQQVLERQDDGGAWFTRASLSNTDSSFADSLVRCMHTYAYRIRTQVLTGDGSQISWSDTVYRLAYDTIAPDSTSLLYATVLKTDVSDGVIQLEFAAASQDNRNGYWLYRTENGGPFTRKLLANTATGSIIFRDSSLNTRDNTYQYRISSSDSCGNESILSKPHQSVQLQAVAENGRNRIFWSAYQGFDSLEYRLEKRTANSAWVPLISLNKTQLLYLDSAVKCDTVYGYRVRAVNLANNLIALSDTSMVMSFEQIPPITPDLLRATVVQTGVTTGKVRLEWPRSVSPDLAKYEVYRNSGSGFNRIAILPPQTFYIDTGLNTRDSAYTYSLQTEDTCRNRSVNAITAHTTLVLKTTPANEACVLNWSAYAGWTVGKYVVYRDGQQVQTLDSTQLSFTDSFRLCTRVYVYRIRAIKSGDTVYSESNDSQCRPFDTRPPEKPWLKVASYDTASLNRVVLRWTRGSSFDVSRFVVFREDLGRGLWTPVFSTGGPNDTSCLDTLRPGLKKHSIQYKLVALDYCGNVSDTSNLGKLMYLSGKAVSTETQVANQLNWTSYTEFKGGVKAYSIFRSLDNGISYSPYVNLTNSDTSYSDNALPDSLSTYCYRILAAEANGGYNENSWSNELCLVQPVRVFFPTAFSPDISYNLNDNFGPLGGFYRSFSLTISDRWGNVVFESKPDKLRWDGLHQKTGNLCAEGQYVWVANFVDESGRQSQRNGTVWLVR